MSVLKPLLGSTVATAFLCSLVVSAAASPFGERFRDPNDYPVQAAAGGQQVDHPAWSFGCAEPDIGERIIPCDEPVWVYGHPCRVGTGIQGVTAPCDSSRR